MPATYVWAPPTGMTGMPPPPPPSFSTLTNWRVGVGPTVFATELPDGDDHLFFIGGISSANCTIPDQTPTAPTNAFAGIHLNFGVEAVPTEIGSPPPPPANVPYSGTVTIADSLAVGELDVDCGAIAQADPNAPTGTAGTLTINGYLDWTGGTLNSSTTPGTIALAATATGVAQPSFTNPGINGTVTLGSTLELLGNETCETGSSLSMIGGTFDVANGGSIVAEACSTLLLTPADKPADPASPPPPTPIKTITINDKDFTPKANGIINIKAKAEAFVEPPTGSASGVLELKGKEAKFTNNGKTTIKGKTEVKFTDADAADYYYQNDDAAVTTLFGGSSISTNTNNRVNIAKGKFVIEVLVVNDVSLPAKIVATNIGVNSGLIFGKDATLDMSGATDARLEVDGDLSIYGTLHVALDPRGTKASLVTATRWILFHEVENVSKAKLEVKERSGNNNDDRKPVGTKWKVAETTGTDCNVSDKPEMTANSTDYKPTTVDDPKILKAERIS